MKVWRNGDIVEAAGAVAADDRGVTLGDGLFETLAVLDGRPLRLRRHLARLEDGARVLGLPLVHDPRALEAAIVAIAAEEGVREGTARITVLRGPGPRGVAPPPDPVPTVLVSAVAGAVGGFDPVRAIVCRTTRLNERSAISGLKTTNYLDAVLGRQEAGARGAEDAVMLNTRDAVAETTTANIFCVVGGDLVTPPVADGALPGTMRALVIERETVHERRLGVDDLRHADEIFVTASTSVRPLVELDGAPVGDGRPGPVATRLKDLPRTAL